MEMKKVENIEVNAILYKTAYNYMLNGFNLAWECEMEHYICSQLGHYYSGL